MIEYTEFTKVMLWKYIQFHGACLNKILCQFLQTSQVPSSVMCISLTEFHPNQTLNVGSKNRNLFTLLSKVCLALHLFSWNPQLPNYIMWRSPVPNFDSDWWSNLEITGRNPVTPLSKIWCSLCQFSWTHACSTTSLMVFILNIMKI
jgi:hypothetical protein